MLCTNGCQTISASIYAWCLVHVISKYQRAKVLLHVCACMHIDTWHLEVVSDSCTKTHDNQQVSTRCVDKASHLIAFCAWASSPLLPVTPSIAGIGRNTSCAVGGFALSTPLFSIQLGAVHYRFMACISMPLFNSCQVALMVPFNLLVGSRLMKAEWRSASMEFGGQCVMITGIAMMPKLCAES